MRKKLEALLEVRKIIAIVVALTFVGLACFGVFEPTFTQTIITMVISYYFGKSTALDRPKGDKEE